MNVEEYEFWLIQRGNKPRTIKRRIYIVQRTFKLCGSLEKSAILSYLVNLQKNQRKAGYLNGIIEDLRIYGRFTNNEDLITFPLFKELPTLKATFSDEEIDAFLALPCPTFMGKNWQTGKTFIRRSDPKGWEMFTVFWTIMAYSGMRCGEVANLTVDRVDFARNVYILEDTKTNDPRYVPISPFISEKVKEYILTLDTPLLFASRRGGKTNGVVIDNSDWHSNFHKRLKRLGIVRKGLTPYSFRHSFATSLLPNSTLFDTMEILGHRNPKTTMKYYHKNIETMKRALEKLPLNIKTPYDKIRILREFVLGLRLNPIEFNINLTNNEVRVEIKS